MSDVAEASLLSYAIVANGFAEGPAQALRDYLVDRAANVVTVFHPLTREQGSMHVVTRYTGGSVVETRSIRVVLRPPISYAVDPLVPLRVPSVDVWFGFNPLACARGLLARRLGQAGKVVLWSVDFVPDRFGSRSSLTRLYDGLDRLCCKRADGRVELTEVAKVQRNHRHALEPAQGPTTIVVPMGAWLARTPTVPVDGHVRRRVVFLGHLVPRQGVFALLSALAILQTRGETVVADVVGTGPEEPMLRERVHALGLANTVQMHGFMADHREVERVLAGASIGIAPYKPNDTTFTRHADPGKLKAYLAAGLPIILTDVPPNARELAREAGASLVTYEPSAIADAISDTLASSERWRARREQALQYARQFDWAVLLPDALARLGLGSS
jgi:glycosyltransferase involved in cell wall biosynthesis